LQYNLDDQGKGIEPMWYLPIIPMVLINGTEGIGTGYASYIPPHNPIDIVANLRLLIKGKEPKEMIPWFRGYLCNNTIRKVSKNKYLSKGRYHQLGKT